MLLNKSVDTLKNIGQKRKEQLSNIGINSINDIIYYFPRQGYYVDFGNMKKINQLEYNQKQIFKAKIAAVQQKKSYRHTSYGLLRVKDSTGYADIYLFGKQVFNIKKFPIGTQVLVFGKIQQGKFSAAKLVTEPTIEIIEDEAEKINYLLPTYALTGTITQTFMRNLIKQVTELLDEAIVKEFIPTKILQKEKFLNRLQAIKNIHYPESLAMLKAAKRRLAFEELYIMQCGLVYYKNKIKTQKRGYNHLPSANKIKKLLSILPFKLTDEQEKVWQEIENDMQDIQPMHRLLQGDVGSGKTIIAVLALVKAVENGFQGAFMAPTEILAMQHFDTLTNLLQDLSINISLLTGSTTKKEREKILTDLKLGKIDILIGTHALIQQDVEFRDLSLVVTDEQHRFGVKQRANLTDKSKDMPDTLVMTATPIPRTMALTVYGDLDVSVIKKLPPGRKPIITLCYNEKKRMDVYKGLVRQVQLGRQAYVVCPLIDESEKVNVLSATDLFTQLTNTVLKDIPTRLLHGKMKSSEKDKIMQEFIEGKVKVLISTTVIEVGINVPNASLMIVEGAERFGLAQLHQLRGRIGRGEHQSYCALIASNDNVQNIERLNLMVEHSDGFVLAQEDLKLRGAGALFGTRQHGLPDLKLANIFSDIDLLMLAREYAKQTIEDKLAFEDIKEHIKLNYDDSFCAIFSS